MSYSIYWIRYDHHTDPLTEGYIGVSKYPDRRMKYHGDAKSQNNSILYRALKKGATQEVLYSYDIKEDAYAMEVEMRPHAKIGWNIIPGGDSLPPVQWGNTFNVGNHKKRHSDEHKQSMSENFSSRKWYTDGTSNKRLKDTDTVPAGFYLGRSKHWKETRGY